MVAVVVALLVYARRPRRSYPACGHCRYDVTGTLGTALRCPECGMDFAQVGILPPQQGNARVHHVVIAGIIMICVVLVGAMISYLQHRAAVAQAAQARQAAMQQQQQLQRALTTQPSQTPQQATTP